MSRIDHDTQEVVIPAGQFRSWAYMTSHFTLERVTDAGGSTVGDRLVVELGKAYRTKMAVGQHVMTDARVPVSGIQIENPTAQDLTVEFGWGLGDFRDFSTIIRDAVAVGPAPGKAGSVISPVADLDGTFTPVNGAVQLTFAAPSAVIIPAASNLLGIKMVETVYSIPTPLGPVELLLTDSNGTEFHRAFGPAGGASAWYLDNHMFVAAGDITAEVIGLAVGETVEVRALGSAQ